MRSVAASLTGAALCVATPGLAATPAPSRTPGIAMPPMPLGAALLLLAQRTGRNILFAAADVAGRRSPAIRARDFDDALGQIARRSHLTVTRMAGGALRLARRPAPPHPRPIHVGHRPDRAPDADIVVEGDRGVQGAPLAGDLPAATLSEDEVRRLPDRTLAEALGRLPGVLTLATSLEGAMGRVDHAGRAIGDFVAVRGLPGSYVETRIDGIALPQSLPYSRGAQLGMMAGAPGTTLRLHTILDASRSGEASAGVIDIDHVAPFDAAPGVRIAVSTGHDAPSRRLGQAAAIAGASIAIAGRTADGRLAVVASGAVARRPFANVEQTYQAGNLYFAIADAAGASAAGIDPAANLRLAAVNAQVTRGVSRDASGHVAIGWRPDAQLTLTASASWATRAVDQDIYQISAQGGRSPDYFTRTPIGDDRYLTRSTRAEAHYWFQTNPETDRLGIAQLAMAWRADRIAVDARVFRATGSTDRPDHIEISFWDPAGTRLTGGVDPAYRRGLPLLPAAATDRAILADPLAYPVHNQGERESEWSRDARTGSDWTGRIDLGTRLRLRIGGLVLRARRDRSTRHDILLDTLPPGTTLRESGLVEGVTGPLLPGIYDDAVPVIGDAALRRLTRHATIAARTIDDLRAGAATIGEDTMAGHAALAISDGDRLDVTLGLRAQVVRLAGRFWLGGNDGMPADGIPYGWNAIRATYPALLPGLAATWRAAPHLTLDAALWTGQTRPSPYQLTGGGGTVRDGDGTILVQAPNPALRPVTSIDLDAGIVWEPAPRLRLTMTGFAKRLDHYLYDAGNMLNDAATTPLGAGIVSVGARNGGIARIFGLETAIAVPLTCIDAALRDIVIGYDGTFLHSAVRLGGPLLAVTNRTQYAPATNSRLWLRYDDGRFSADVSYRATAAYIQEYGVRLDVEGGRATITNSALDTWVRPAARLDLGLAYTQARATIRLTIRNALRDIVYRSTIGRHSDAVPQTILGGRQLGLEWSMRF